MTQRECGPMEDVYTKAREQLDCLPNTGADYLGWLILAAVICIVLGAAIRWYLRRRRFGA